MEKTTILGLTATAITVMFIAGVVAIILLFVIKLALYIIEGVGLYNMSRKTGLKKAWYGFVPYLKLSIIGAMAQSCKLKRASAIKCYDKLLPAAALASSAVNIVALGFMTAAFVNVVFAAFASGDEALKIINVILFPIVYSRAVLLVALAVKVIYKVIYYIALYRTFALYNTKNGGLYTLICVLLPVLTPVFINISSGKNPFLNKRFCKV